MNLRRIGITAVALGLLAGASGGVTAQDGGEPTDPESWRTKEVAPGVLRILDDGAGHDLTQKWRRGKGVDYNHIAVGPDGEVWLSVTITVARSDDRRRQESRLWPLGRAKTYGRGDGLGERHYSLAFDDDGRLWVQGDRVATFVDGEWSSTRASNGTLTADGSVWIGGGMGVEQWDGTQLVPHLEGVWTGSTFAGPDGTVGVESWDGLRLFDGTGWQTISRRNAERAISDDDALAVRGNNGKGLRLYRDGQEATVLDSVRVNSMSAAPDGSFWVSGRVGKDRGGVYRIDPAAVFAALAESGEADGGTSAEDASST